MLVLGRKLNESLMIGDDVEIIIAEIKGDQVKLGIKAPRQIKVYRKEIYEEIQTENIKASQTGMKPSDLKGLENLIIKKNI